MALTLELRHLQGAPASWPVDDGDDVAVRGLLRDLRDFAADPESRTAVLVATEEDGTISGAWNRDGARRFAHTLAMTPPSPDPKWIEMYGVLDIAVTGP